MTPSHNLIDVTIPTWNRPEVLPRSLASIQGAASVTVVDDGSHLTPSLPEAVDFIRVNHCGLPGRIKNLGIRHGSAPYVCVVDDDDYLLPNALPQIEEYIRANGFPKVVMTRQLWLEKSGHLTESVVSLTSPWVMRQLVVVARDLFEQVGGFPEDIPAAVDSNYYAKLWRCTEVLYMPKFLYVKDLSRQDSISVRLKTLQRELFYKNQQLIP